MKRIPHAFVGIGLIVVGLLGASAFSGCARARVVPLSNREVVCLTADDVVGVMRQAGFSDQQILDHGTSLRNRLATAGAAELRLGDKVEAIFAVRGQHIHVSSRRSGSFIYDVGPSDSR